MTYLGKASSAVIAALIVTSCGGDDSPSPTPVATATPTPTPTPTPTFSYTEFADLTGVQDFGTACISYGGVGGPIPGVRIVTPFSSDGNIDLNADAGEWTISELNGGTFETLGPADIVEQTDLRTRYERTGGSIPLRLQVITPEVNGTAALYGRAITYLLPLASGGAQSAWCSLGVPTDPDDIPEATTVTYSDISLRGFLLEENPAGGQPLVSSVVGGSGTITGNTTTGEITFSLSYTVEDSAGAQRTIGPVTGDVSIDLSGAGKAGYAGLINIGGVPEYELTGAFYGPQGRETGFNFAGQVDQDGNGQPESFVLIGGYATR